MCSKGFELEDDIEFCPKIVDLETLGVSHDSAHNSAHSPQEKPHPFMDSSFNRTYYASKIRATSETTSANVSTPRIRKPLEIVDPHTGMKIESSKFSPHSTK